VVIEVISAETVPSNPPSALIAVAHAQADTKRVVAVGLIVPFGTGNRPHAATRVEALLYGRPPETADIPRRLCGTETTRITSMGFFNGRVTFLRFAVGGEAPQMFGDEQLEKLQANVAGRQTLETSDGIEAGWSGGKSVLDTTFDLAKNIINDTLHFDFRVDTDRLPADLLKAYYEADLAALIKDNKSGLASAKQKSTASSWQLRTRNHLDSAFAQLHDYTPHSSMSISTRPSNRRSSSSWSSWGRPHSINDSSKPGRAASRVPSSSAFTSPRWVQERSRRRSPDLVRERARSRKTSGVMLDLERRISERVGNFSDVARATSPSFPIWLRKIANRVRPHPASAKA